MKPEASGHLAGIDGSTGSALGAADGSAVPPAPLSQVAAAPPATQHIVPPPFEQPRRITDGALYPGYYTWYVFMAALDVLMTRIVLSEFFGGYEVNWLAQWIMKHGSMKAATIFKFTSVVVVILICEFIGRRDLQRGRTLARWAVVITAMPVLISFSQLLVDVYAWIADGDQRLHNAPGMNS